MGDESLCGLGASWLPMSGIHHRDQLAEVPHSDPADQGRAGSPKQQPPADGPRTSPAARLNPSKIRPSTTPEQTANDSTEQQRFTRAISVSAAQRVVANALLIRGFGVRVPGGAPVFAAQDCCLERVHHTSDFSCPPRGEPRWTRRRRRRWK